ncbi:MAG: hypothetical protein WCP58_09910, partial [bacterium]
VLPFGPGSPGEARSGEAKGHYGRLPADCQRLGPAWSWVPAIQQEATHGHLPEGIVTDYKLHKLK